MVNYRRAKVPGAAYFFTATLRDRRSRLLTDHIDALRDAVRKTKRQWPFTIAAAVVLPDHLHTIWTLPEGDADFSKRWQAIKSRFTRSLLERGVEITKNRRGEYDLWQRRFWEHLIRDERDLARHVDYIHYNPVKHGLVAKPTDWPWSSIHRYVRMKVITRDWGTICPEGEFGE
jgi:putative transposase